MSVVTNVIVTGIPGLYPEYAGQDPPHIQACLIDGLNRLLLAGGEEGGCGQKGGLLECSAHSGGTKNMEAHIWMGGFNYLPVHFFVEGYRKLVAEGQRGELVEITTLMICRQDDRTFEVVPNAPDDCNWDYRQRTNEVKA